MVGTPPQLFTTLGAAAITTPAVSASLKVSPVRAADSAGLVTVKVSVLTWPTPMVVGANALSSEGWLCTVSELAVTLLVMRAGEAMLALVLVYGPPTTLEVTSTRTWHEATVTFIAAAVTTIELPPAAAVTKAGLLARAPPAGQLLCTFGVAATSTLAGRLSVKPMPDCAGLPAPLVIWKVSVEVPPESITVGANALLSEACTTVSVRLVTLLVRTPPTVTLAAALRYPLAVVLVTSTLTVQVLGPTAAFTPLPPMAKVLPPAAAVMVGAPPQLLTTFGVAAITTPAVKASLKVSPVRAADSAGLITVKVRVEVLPTSMVDGANALSSDGRLCTVSELAVTLLGIRAGEAMLALVLVYGPPTTLEVTSTRTWHEATALVIAAPVTTIELAPAVAVTNAGPPAKAPPAGQLLCTLGVAATSTLPGRLSVKPMPDCDGLPAPLVSVKVRVDVLPWVMTVGLKI